MKAIVVAELTNKLGNELLEKGYILSHKKHDSELPFTVDHVYQVARFGWIWKVTTDGSWAYEIKKIRRV